jgi:ubiquinone/menaquinone biosynthesis C-methylase UbiE
MKRKGLVHPRVFDEESWALWYLRNNQKAIRRHGQRVASVLRRRGLTKGRLLDAGCGFGAAAVELARAMPHLEIVGVDLAEPLLRIANRLAHEAGVGQHVRFLRRDVMNTGFPADDFDLVVNMFMVHIVEDPVGMLNEIERVAAPDGTVLITDLRRSGLAWIEKELATALTMKEAEELIGKSQLRAGTHTSGLYWWDYFTQTSNESR